MSPIDDKRATEGAADAARTRGQEKKLTLGELRVESFLSEEEAKAVWGGDGPKNGSGDTYTYTPPNCPVC